MIVFFLQGGESVPYPTHLPPHPQRETWGHEDCFAAGRPFYDVRGYRHNVYPLLGMHDHTFYEINVVLEGEGQHYIGTRSCPARPGAVFVLPPYVPHGYATEGDMVVYHVLLSAAFMQRYTDQLGALEGYTMLFEVEPLLRGEYARELFYRLEGASLEALLPALDRLAGCCEQDSPNARILCHGLGLQIIATLCAHAATATGPAAVTDDLPILRSMEHIHAHCGEAVSPRHLARQAGMSYATFLRHFTRVTGKTPHAYLTDCRLQKARQLLRHTDMSVVQVALECGFYDSAHFIRTFRQHTGMGPSAYAKAPGR